MLKTTIKRRLLILLLAGVLLVNFLFVPFEQNLDAYCELEPSARWTIRNYGNGTIGMEWDIYPNNTTIANKYIQIETPDLAEITLQDNVHMGQRVEKGSLLAEFRSSHTASLVSVTEAELRREAKRLVALKAGERSELLDVERKRLQRAEIERDYYASEYDRIKQLYDAGLVSDSQYEEVKQRFDALNAEVELAEAKVRAFKVGVHPAEEEVQKAEIERLIALLRGKRELIGSGKGIESPLSGLLVKSNKPDAILTVVGVDSLRCKIVLPENFASALLVGSAVKVNFPILEKSVSVEIKDTGFYGGDTIAFYGIGYLNNSNGLLKPGMHGSATVSIGRITLFQRLSSRIGAN
ncbi:HlyD family secretion protein [bacterium]|nr:HlyD family secretion protein [bacterium]